MTPRLWTAFPTSDGDFDILDIEENDIACAYDEDDAKLIATAPRMLKELKQLVEVIQDVDPRVYQDQIDSANIVIKSADGE